MGEPDAAKGPVPESTGRPRSGTDKIKDNRMIISEAGLAQLKAYKYQSGAYTPLDNFLNTYWWGKVIDFVPMGIAPNLITLIGLLHVVTGFFTLTYYCPKLEGEAPRWVYFFCAYNIFAYQTLDAIDGKQARRTNSSSPLGQLFDHGCDSVSTTFIMLTQAAAANAGPTWQTLAFLFGVQIPFFLAQWQEYHTHVMNTAVGIIGVTEGHWASIMAILVTGIFGPSIWEVRVGPVNLREAGIAVMLVGTGFMAFNNIAGVAKDAKNKTTAFIQLIPLVVLAGLGLLWATDSDEDSPFKTHPRLTAGTLGMLFTHLSNQMILCGMTHMPYPTFQWLLVPLPFIFVNSYFNLSPRHDDVILGVYCGVVMVYSYIFVKHVIEEICVSLGIYCLKLGPRNDKED